MREMKYVIGLDLGSSSTKGMLCDNLGVVHACASRSHAQTTLYAGWQEQDANLTWYDECIDIVSELVQTSQIRPNCIERIGITGCVPAMILINKKGTILRPAILHTDVRAQQELDTIRSYNLDVHHGHLLPKLLWIQQHERDLFDQIHAVLLPHSYVVYKLTGVLSCDYDSATIFGGLFNEQDLAWNQEILNTFDIPSHILVQPQATTAITGTIMPKSATAFGLSEQTQVIVGSGDSFATLLGSGVCDAHELMFYWGTSGTRVYTENSPIHYLEGPHFSSQKALFVGKFFSCGESLQHMRSLLGGHSFATLDKEAEALDDTHGLWYIPQLKQQLLSSTQTQASHLMGLQPIHHCAHVHRAIVEGIAFSSMEPLEDKLHSIEHIHVCGGGARSALARTIIATLAPCPVWYTPYSEASRGIALLSCLAGKKTSEQGNLLRLWRNANSPNLIHGEQSKKDFYREKLATFRSLSQRIQT